MKKILERASANVSIKDNETGKILFKGHNLFVDSGRTLIADIFKNAISFNPGFLVCDLGDDATVPDAIQVDLVHYLSPFSVAITGGYPISIDGEPSGVHFQFGFTNSSGAPVTIRELGLFYRANSDAFPFPGSDPVSMRGLMIARLKTTLSSITVSAGSQFTIDWKIIF